MVAVIECERVTKRYGDVVAVDGVSLDTQEGEVLGLVGPNGAGKTTLIEMIESLRTPDSGSIRVLGLDPTREAAELKQRIGVQLQTTSIQPNITVREAIELFASLYRRPLANPLQLLETLSLQDKANSRFRRLSGGQKQRVAIALAMVNDPPLLFLDELTTGLDPQARRSVWDLIRTIREQGKTILLTTHYMEEAATLCDRVGVIDHGRIIALDTPQNLVSQLGRGEKVLFTLDGQGAEETDLRGLPAVSRVEQAGNSFALYTGDASATLQALLGYANAQGLRLGNIRTEFSNLDDVFLALTGRELRE